MLWNAWVPWFIQRPVRFTPHFPKLPASCYHTRVSAAASLISLHLHACAGAYTIANSILVPPHIHSQRGNDLRVIAYVVRWGWFATVKVIHIGWIIYPTETRVNV
ncbi:hypothetical protein BDQ94DRAFT_151651 [Aspergillus welwitschiae]|uniref:Uncharacterized protein n=1 Tax=Aspergillus welwitschiae TaxID=1341132 RepID=A0A3F3PPF8_9EURO|nr:hypothetical protein BDQ94DRAFT_151651 [Aspergillus welwitschiae]RDH28831.1 hypothetical protein BDQ94DRAFT_151651 [Aspergillus welwitschiae]